MIKKSILTCLALVSVASMVMAKGVYFKYTEPSGVEIDNCYVKIYKVEFSDDKKVIIDYATYYTKDKYIENKDNRFDGYKRIEIEPSATSNALLQGDIYANAYDYLTTIISGTLDNTIDLYQVKASTGTN